MVWTYIYTLVPLRIGLNLHIYTGPLKDWSELTYIYILVSFRIGLYLQNIRGTIFCIFLLDVQMKKINVILTFIILLRFKSYLLLWKKLNLQYIQIVHLMPQLKDGPPKEENSFIYIYILEKRCNAFPCSTYTFQYLTELLFQNRTY